MYISTIPPITNRAVTIPISAKIMVFCAKIDFLCNSVFASRKLLDMAIEYAVSSINPNGVSKSASGLTSASSGVATCIAAKANPVDQAEKSPKPPQILE